MATIITTPMAVDANAYITRAEANTYFTDRRLHDAAWAAATDADKDAAILWAAGLLDASFDWDGSKRTNEQAMRWPRGGLVDRDGVGIDPDTIPTFIEYANAEYALYLIGKDPLKLPSILGQGITRVRVDVISVEADPRAVSDLVPPSVMAYVSFYGSLIESAKGGRTVGQIKLSRA